MNQDTSYVSHTEQKSYYVKPEPIAGVVDGAEVEDIVTFVKDIVKVGRDARDDHPNWNDFASAKAEELNLKVGNHFSVFPTDHLGLDVAKDQYQVENHISNAIELVSGVIADERVGFLYKANEADGIRAIELADQVTLYMEYKNNKLGFVGKYSDIIENHLTFGHVQTQLFHDFSENFPLGRDVFRLLDPLAIFFAPGTTDWNEAKYRGAVIIEEREKVEQHWSHLTGERVKIEDDTSLDSQEVKYWSLEHYMGTENSTDDHINRGLTYYVEYKDTTLVEDKEGVIAELYRVIFNKIKSKTKKKEKPMRPKYPKGRLFVLYNNTLVYDGENPLKGGMSQFQYMACKKVPGKLLGIGYPRQLYDLQRNINEAVTQITVNSALTGNSQKIRFPGAFAPGTTMSVKPGQIYDVTEEKYLSLNPLIPINSGDNTGQAFQRYQEAVKAFYMIVGLEEAIRGKSMSGDSGVKVIALDKTAIRRFRPYTRNAECCILRPYAETLYSMLVQYPGSDEDELAIGDEYSESALFVNMRDLIQQADEQNVKFMLILTLNANLPDQREYKANRLLQMKQLFQNDPDLDALVYIAQDDPNVVELGYRKIEMQKIALQNQKVLYEAGPALLEMANTYKQAKGMQAIGQLTGELMAEIEHRLQQAQFNQQQPVNSNNQQ